MTSIIERTTVVRVRSLVKLHIMYSPNIVCANISYNVITIAIVPKQLYFCRVVDDLGSLTLFPQLMAITAEYFRQI
jgi:hypothetical protein